LNINECVFLCFRYLASGDSYKSIGYSYRTGDQTVAKIVNEVSIPIWRNMQQLYLPQPTREMWISIASFIDARSMGRFSDGSIFSSSQLGRKLDKGTLQLPPPADLPSFEHALPYVFVGDEVFPLMPNLMRPYPRRRVMGSYENKVFNYWLSRATQNTLVLRLIPCSETI
ncbi:hypothetical protein B7P43_G18389, partial [Cryptotermes secundus]